jgi:hypothetical protein
MPAPVHEPKACRSCSAPIFWAQLVDERGEVVLKADGNPKAIPVDAEPSEKGNVQLAARGTGIVARVLGNEQAKQVRDAAWALGGKHTLRLAHFASCPQAGEWRRTLMPSRLRRLLCRVFGHAYVVAGVEGLLEFHCCVRCGAMPYSRGGR